MNNTVNHIFDVIDDLLKQKDHIIIVIDGMACSGKTTLANILFFQYLSNIYKHFFAIRAKIASFCKKTSLFYYKHV